MKGSPIQGGEEAAQQQQQDFYVFLNNLAFLEQFKVFSLFWVVSA